MGRNKRWNKSIADGVMEIQLSSWKYFHDFIRQQMLDYSHYVWRGQRDASWQLKSSLDRVLDNRGAEKYALAEQLLNKFKRSTRGRRGPNPARIDNDSDWWALGQHHGLHTPLLDWTESPFVALYFAFDKELAPKSGSRCVWALSDVEKINKIIREANASKPPLSLTDIREPTIDYVRPHSDENARLVAQSGLFTKVPLGHTVDDWIRKYQNGNTTHGFLLKIVMPDSDRPECLRTLNRMNINHMSLFPDLYGSSEHCNKSIEISHY